MRVRPSALVIENNRALLLHYKYGGVDVYAIPGGSPECTETLEEALVRELKEELSVSVAPGGLFLVCETLSGPHEEPVLHTIFSSCVTSGTPLVNPAHTSSSGLVWAEINTLSDINMYPNAGKSIFEIIIGGRSRFGVSIGRVNQQWY